MQKSNSTLSFGPSTEHTKVTREVRSRPRSSLDTFVISGRTRLPSSRTSILTDSSQDATNIQIAQALLDRGARPRSRQPPISAVPRNSLGGSREFAQRSPISRSGSGRHTMAHPTTPRRIKRQGVFMGTPTNHNYDVISISPRRRTEAPAPQATPHHSVTDLAEDPFQDQTDGPNDTAGSRQVSRMASMSWSSISQRNISNSSASTQASRASDYRHDYNVLAEDHGLPLLSSDLSEEGSNSIHVEKMTQKPHHESWFTRKFLRRTPSTYNFKAKTTFKPLARKKSFSSIRSHSDKASTNILKGKSLDEMSLLGGTQILVLPADFAVGKLELPTCLSATAAYILKHDCNAPGIFRVCGTTTTINALYDYFDHQFSDAGSPSLVEETVGHGFLPTEPEHTLADIASLFKKIIMGLPGGLLGSVELFEVLRSILVDQRANLESSEQDTVQLPAKLIALAISSVVSHLRLNLIQAVIGLVAHFGYQGDKFQEAEKVAAEERGERNQSRSEVMGSESLSRVFGALLLGDLTDEVEVTNHSPTTLDTKPPPSNSANQDQEVSKKSKKQKHVTFPTKSDNDAKLLAHVNRANLMTDIVRSLLLIWQEVVKQLRELNAVSTSNVHLSRSKDHLQKLPIRAARGVPLRNSREEMQLSNILHGRAPPGIPFPYQVKQTVRVSSRSPMGRIATHTSEDSNTGLTGPSKASLQLAQPSPAGSNGTPSSAGRGHGSANKASPSPPDAQTPFTEDLPVIHRQKRKKSDNSMDPMAMGTFLTPPNNSTAALMQFPPALHNSPIETPRKQSHSGSSDYVPETAVRMLPRPGQQQTSVSPIQKSIVRKPLPAIPSSPSKDSVTYLNLGEGIDPIKPKSNQSSIFTESSSRTTKKSSPSSSHQSEQESLARFPDESTYPPRRSSLLRNQQLALSPNDRLLTSRDLDEHSTWPRFKSDSATKNLTSRKTAGVVINKGQAFEDAKQDCAVGMESLAQGFPKASGAIYNNEQTRLPIEYPQIPKAHAYAGPIPQENYHGNSSGALANMSPGRESMIPRPVKEVGRGRSPMRTPPHAKHIAQPTPKSYSQERHFVHDLDQDTDAELASANGKVEERTLNDAPKPVEGIMPSSIQQRTGSDQSTSRDINTYSDQPSSHKYSKALEDDFDKQKTERKNLQRDPSIGGILSPSQSNALGLDSAALEMSSLSPVDSSLNASEGLKQFKRHQSINGTRHQEVRFLWRLLDNQFEETWIARRDLDTLREAIEAKAYSPSKGSSRGSWSKGMWSEDVKEAKEERNMWRKRAEVAESKIANLEKHGVDVNILLGSKKEEDFKHKQVTAGNRFSVEVVVENDDETPESVVDCYVGEGWEARDLDEKFT